MYTTNVHDQIEDDAEDDDDMLHILSQLIDSRVELPQNQDNYSKDTLQKSSKQDFSRHTHPE